MNGIGFYEKGMELHEMRQIMNALQMTETECETDFSDTAMQQSLGESQLDFVATSDARVLNSTMISCHPISPHTSPILSSEKIIVVAEVHHSIDWSPPNDCGRKEHIVSTDAIRKPEFVNDFFDTDHMSSHVSGLSQAIIDEHSLENNSLEQNTAPTNSGLLNTIKPPFHSSEHIINEAASECRVCDSGFTINNESLNNTSNNGTPPANTGLIYLESYHPDLCNDVHKVFGPVSVRRIHDSGVNISRELQAASVVDNSKDNLSLSSENAMGIPSSSALTQHDLGNGKEN